MNIQHLKLHHYPAAFADARELSKQVPKDKPLVRRLKG